MSRGMPSMTALLGLLAIAGYQNRDKLAEMLGHAAGSVSKPESGGQPQAQGDLPGGLSSMLGSPADRLPALVRRLKQIV